MLVIRLARVGRKNQAHFRLVAAEKLRTPTGKYVTQLGHYNPHSKEFTVDKNKLAELFKNGAQPSSTVVKLLKRHKITMPKWAEANLVTKKKAPKVKKGAEDETAQATAEDKTAKDKAPSKEAPKEEPQAKTPKADAAAKADGPASKPDEPSAEAKDSSPAEDSGSKKAENKE